MTSTTVTPPRDNRRTLRAVRYAARRHLWSASTLRRVRYCGRAAVQGVTGIGVRVTSGAAGYAGLQSCGSVWACPVCSSKVLSERTDEVAAAVNHWTADGGQVAMATLTMRHDAGDRLADLWDAGKAGWEAVTSGRAHAAEKRLYGVERRSIIASGPRAGQVRRSWSIPWLRATEVTHGQHGWHVHLHVLLFLPSEMTPEQLTGLYDGMWGRWARGLAGAGIDGSLKVNRVRFYSEEDGLQVLGRYVTKGTFHGPTAGRALGLEVTRGDLKSARFGNRSHMELLRDVVDSRVPQDIALWEEFERVSKGRRAMTWAGGARKLLGLAEVERTDEDIADDETGTARDTQVTIALGPDGWGRVLGVPGLQARVLAAAEDGLDLLVAALDDAGVAFWFPDDDAGTVSSRRQLRRLAAA